MNLNISVITPVYNAEKYIKKAVESALFHNCVKEVILVEDNSPDNALAVCKQLEKHMHKLNSIGILMVKTEVLALVEI